MFSSDHPANDEIEVTLLGGGVGESCVVHLGARRWLIVDTFREALKTGPTKVAGPPAAHTYLASLGVKPHEVRAVVLTHLHADHYSGLSQLVALYPEATLFLPDALAGATFAWLFDPQGKSYAADVHNAFHAAEGRRSFIKVHEPVTGFSSLAHVIAMGPSLLAVEEAKRELTDEFRAALDETPDRGSRKVSKFLRDQNLTSVSLYVEASVLGEDEPSAVAMLGADMIQDGWQAAYRAFTVDAHAHDLKPVTLLKAPHHGSAGALNWEVLTSMLVADAEVLVAPYSPSAIPGESQLVELSRRFGRVWTAAPSGPPYTREVDPSGRDATRTDGQVVVIDGAEVHEHPPTAGRGQLVDLPEYEEIDEARIYYYSPCGAVQARTGPGRLGWQIFPRHPAKLWERGPATTSGS